MLSGSAGPTARIMHNIDKEVLSEYLTPETVEDVYLRLGASSDPSARALQMYLFDGLPDRYLEDAGIHLPLQIEAADGPKPSRRLDSALRTATRNGATMPGKTYRDHFQNAANWGLVVLQQFFFEMRTKICGKGKQPTPVGHMTKLALGALGARICTVFGVSKDIGVGIAAVMVTNMADVGKRVLCRMTSPEELSQYFA